MAGRLETTNADRLDHEIALQRQGYVPLTAYDAPYPHFDTLLPACRIEQVVTDADHGRILWSHPGPSGLDPRAVVPLAIVRVADGFGRDRLDPPITLSAAARQLLTTDVEDWLLRSRHRALASTDQARCLYEIDGGVGGCRTHPVADPLLQQAADALGDTSYAHCRPRRWRHPSCTQWGMPSDKPHDLAGLVRCALQATLRLGGWMRRGVVGSAAWDLTRYGVTVEQLEQWHAAGFSTEEVGAWWPLGQPGPLARRRDAGESPYQPIDLPPTPKVDGSRGITAFVAWKMSCHVPDRWRQLVHCTLCRAKDEQSPCRTCRAEGRTEPFVLEWSEHAPLATLGTAYRPGRAENPVACGDRNCRTRLALSAAGAEGMQS